MPLYDYKCDDCGHKQEHYLAPNSEKKLICPSCESKKYKRLVNSFMMNVEYTSVEEINEYKIDPAVKETQAKIGREVLDQDTKTLDNIFGKDKVENTFYGTDD